MNSNQRPKTASSRQIKAPQRGTGANSQLAKGSVTVGADSIRQYVLLRIFITLSCREMLQAHGTSKSLEAEYIRSLHKQIYLLELENKYIREELGKAKASLKGDTEVQVRVTTHPA